MALASALFRQIESFVFLNFFLAAFNAALLFKVIRSLTKDKVIAYAAACILAASVSMEITLLRILTEQLSLLVTLTALGIFISDTRLTRRRAVLTGLLLGMGLLIRSSSFFYPLAFAGALLFGKQAIRERLSLALVLLLSSFGLMAAWEIFVYARFGAFFPQYPQAFRNFYLAAFYAGGHLSGQVPVVRPLADLETVSFLWTNAAGVFRALFSMLRVLMIFSLAGIGRVLFRERERGESALMFLAIFQVCSLILFYPYVRLNDFELVRFLLVPVLALLITGLRDFKVFCFRFFPKTRSLFFFSVISIVFLTNMRQSLEVLDVYWKEERSGKVQALKEVSEWVKQRTQGQDLVAAEEFIYGGVYLDRPTVAFLERKLLNYNNLYSFKSIYNPRSIIVEKSAFKDKILKDAGYRPVFEGRLQSPFAIYEPADKA